jgi:hypothetical protein
MEYERRSSLPDAAQTVFASEYFVYKKQPSGKE